MSKRPLTIAKAERRLNFQNVVGRMPTMAFVVAKPNNRWEVRESYRTENGPRSRTLASFSELTPPVEKLVVERSAKDVDIEGLRLKATRAGAPVTSEIDLMAGRLLKEMQHGRSPNRRLSNLIRDSFRSKSQLSHEVDRMKMWTGASQRERAQALEDLLGFGDAIPDRDRRGRSAKRSEFPRISSG